MENQSAKSPKSDVISQAKGQAWVGALAQVRPELGLVPAEAERPLENVAAFVEQVYAWVERQGGAETEASLVRLELLAEALARAEHDFVWQPPVDIAEDMTGLRREYDALRAEWCEPVSGTYSLDLFGVPDAASC